MGGYGSGRWGLSSKKYTVEDCLTLDLNFLLREGGVSPRSGKLNWSRGGVVHSSIGYSFEPGPLLRLNYTKNGESVNIPVFLLSTTQRLGGVRYWMKCPLVINGISCNNRCSKLYCTPNCKFFGCRSCLDLTYESCQESHKFDAMFTSLSRRTGKSLAKVKQALKDGEFL